LRKGNAHIKITGSQTYVVGNLWKNWLFVRLETDEGLHGVGEGTLNGFARTVEAAIHELEPLYIGVIPFDVETITLRMLRDVYSDGGQTQGSAMAAIETACWDITGKATGQPLYSLIGDAATTLCAATRTAGTAALVPPSAPMRRRERL